MTNRTHCKHGHELTPENSIQRPYLVAGGSIAHCTICRECVRKTARESQRRRYVNAHARNAHEITQEVRI